MGENQNTAPTLEALPCPANEEIRVTTCGFGMSCTRCQRDMRCLFVLLHFLHIDAAQRSLRSACVWHTLGPLQLS